MDKSKFLKLLGGAILIGANLFFYAKSKNLEIAKILFYFCCGISIFSFLCYLYNLHAKKEEDIFWVTTGYISSFILIMISALFINHY